MLHTRTWGPPRGGGRPVVLLHGFTQSAQTWAPIAEALAPRHRVVAIDAPGHGGSAEVETGLADSADLMAKTAGGPSAWVGYSMGGRFALHVALRHPQLVERLVLISTTAGIDDPDERAARQAHDEELADRIVTEGVPRFLDWWLKQPLFATLPPDARDVDSRRGNRADGLASSLRRAGTGSQEPLWEQLPRLDMPTLVVAGSLDDKYVGLARRLADTIGVNAELAFIDGAGHACHLEQPQRFLDVLGPFLD